MNVPEYRFVTPLDALVLRGNKLFGDPGSFGESQMPPWPSVAAGAIRSRMLVDRQVDIAAFSKGKVNEFPDLGTPKAPGSFTLAGFHLALHRKSGITEILMPRPADLVISRSDITGSIVCNLLQPTHVGLPSSFPLGMLPVLAQGTVRTKPESGWWLTQDGWDAYLHGSVPTSQQCIHASKLWTVESRVGIGMASDTRSVETGKLFTTQAILMHKAGNLIRISGEGSATQRADYDVGFLAVVTGAIPPEDGLLRFGGDGRAAAIMKVQMTLPEPDYEAISASRRCRIVLTSPGLFPEGWRLPGVDMQGRVSLGEGIRARLVSAAIPSAETLSGWDLAKWQPKPAQKVAPTGSVYWLDDLDASPVALRKLVETGFWGDPKQNDSHSIDESRRAEGFNRLMIAAWPIN